jgi:acyl carrier protein
MIPQSLDIVRHLAVETLDLPERKVTGTSTFRDVGIDSLSAIDLVFAVESHFGITLSANDVAQMHSLTDLAACVDRLTAREACLHEA